MKDTLLKTLLPWLCYALFSYFGLSRLAAPAAIMALAFACSFSGSSFKPVDMVLIFYFSAIALGVGVFKWNWLSSWQPVIAPSMLSLMAFASVLLGRPFTLPYARESVKDPAMWGNPHFYRVNVILSLVWAGAFLLAAFAQFWALGKPGLLWIATALCFLATGIAAWATWWFPPWYHKRFFEPLSVREDIVS